MRLFGLLLVAVLTDTAAAIDHADPDCDDCHENGPWYPLFHPSQIISSEFPEHEQYRSHESPPPLTYATARPQVSRESQSQEYEETPQVVELGSREVGGVDSPVKQYGGHGQHRVEWDHYGDITTVATVAYNSLEERGGPPRVSGEDRSDVSENLSPPTVTMSEPLQDSSVRSQEESFFDNGSFFDEKQSSKESFPENFEVSNEFPFSGEHYHHSNSIEEFSSHEYLPDKKPVATSYASISSVFESRPVPRARDLLHPSLAFNDIPHYIDLPRARHTTNSTKQYRVHEAHSREDPGVLFINHVDAAPRKKPAGHRPTSYVPLDHPVYRYVKVHGGMTQPQTQGRSTLRWDDIHPQLRSQFPFKYLRPRVHVQSHKTYVHHVVPTKDPFADSFFRESQKIEHMKPPPLGQNLYYFKKKPSPIEMKNIARRRQSPGYMYIIKRNKNNH